MSSIQEKIATLEKIDALCAEHERITKKSIEQLNQLQQQARHGWDDERADHFFKKYNNTIVTQLEEHYNFSPKSRALIADKIVKLKSLMDK